MTGNQKAGKGHVKQIGLKCFAEDMAIINRIKSEQGFSYDSDAIRYALILEERNSLLERRLQAMEKALHTQSEEIKNNSWRNNAIYDLLLKVARHFNLVK